MVRVESGVGHSEPTAGIYWHPPIDDVKIFRGP